MYLNKNILNIIPVFEPSYNMPTSNSASLIMQIPDKTVRYQVNYILEISELIKDKFYNDKRFYNNWEYNDEEILKMIKELPNDYWTAYKVEYSGINRHYQLNNLNSSNIINKCKLNISILFKLR